MAIKESSLWMALILGISFFFIPQSETSGQEFYKGKTVRIIVGAPPGGGYDTYARLLARHLGKYILGNPRTIVQNMPGGGGMIAANYLYGVSTPDGLTIAHLVREIVQSEVLGLKGLQFQADKYGWIGSGSISVFAIVAREDAPIRTLKDLMEPKKQPLLIGSTAPPSSLFAIPTALNLIFEKDVGRPLFQIVPGYRGRTPIQAAMERGEVDGIAGWGWDSVKATVPHWLQPAPGKGYLKLIGYVGARRNLELDQLGVPFINDIIEEPKDRTLIDFVVAPTAMNRPFATPPGVPPERLGILRQAFMKTFNDKDFLVEAKRLNTEVSPISGEEVEELVRSILRTPPEVVQIVKKILSSN